LVQLLNRRDSVRKVPNLHRGVRGRFQEQKTASPYLTKHLNVIVGSPAGPMARAIRSTVVHSSLPDSGKLSRITLTIWDKRLSAGDERQKIGTRKSRSRAHRSSIALWGELVHHVSRAGYGVNDG